MKRTSRWIMILLAVAGFTGCMKTSVPAAERDSPEAAPAETAK